MNRKKKGALEKRGWKVGSAKEFLGLSPAEEAYIEFKMALSRYLQERRKSKRLTQTRLAKFVRTSQSRVAKMEKGEPSVTVDLIVRSLFALGTKPKEIASVIASKEKR